MIRCQACGHDNPETNRFCGECAAPLDRAEPVPEVRKTVSIVFCDVVGSTAMGEALDPESLRRVMERYFDAMSGSIERHGGTVEKFIGDAVMAVFGVPRVHEDDALRAVRAAADMRAALATLNDDLERDHGMTFSCRIGVNTGEVVAGAGDQKIVTGDAVNVAARLEQGAATGEILLGEATYALVRDAVTVEPVEAVDAKGKTEPVPAFRLIEVTPGAAGFTRHLDAPIVGRERELTLLRGAFERTVTDQACQLFTVLGVGGVGKSRLMAAFIDELGDRATVLRGRCLPYGEGITFFPLTEALIEAADLNEADTPDAARAKLAALAGSGEDAERIAERVAQVIGIAGSQIAPEETLWAIRMLLERLAADRPLVYVIDDLQWAEPRFLELVEHVADLAHDAPILLACMARPELLDDHPAWAGGKLNATSILIEPLSSEECRTLVANLLADDTVDDAVRARIAEAAEGHPLYAEEITGLLVDEGRLVLKEGRWVATGDLSDVPVPPTISALLAARLDRLPSHARRLIDIASVMGQVFYSGAVRALADDGADEVGTGLTSLVRKQFVRPERSDLPASEALAFRHLLIRDAAYEAIPKATRADLHEGFAAWLDAAGGSLGEQDEIVGYHLEQAYRFRTELGPTDERDKEVASRAAAHLARAGGQAGDRGDLQAMVNLLSRAVQLLPKQEPYRDELLAELGEALLELGEYAAAGTALEEAIAGAMASGDRRIEGYARVTRIWVEGSTEPEGLSERSRREAERSIPVFEELADERGLAKAWMLLSQVYWDRCEYGAMDAALRRGVEHARRAGNRREESIIAGTLLVPIVWGPVPVTEGIGQVEALLAHYRGWGWAESGLITALAGLNAMLGRFEESRTFMARARRIADDLGMRAWIATQAFTAGAIELYDGRPREAEEKFREGFEILEGFGEKGGFSTMAGALAEAAYLQGRFEEAERLTEVSEDAAATTDIASQVTWRAVKAKVLAHRGDLGPAESLAREAVVLAGPTDGLEMIGGAHEDLAEVLRMSGRDGEASAELRRALELYERKGILASATRARSLLEGP